MPGTSELLTPTLQSHKPRAPGARRPWRLGAQLYVAFIGGVPGVTIIALINATRLRAPARVLAMIAGAAVLGMAAVVAFLAIFFGKGGDDTGPSGLQIGVQVISVLAWGLMFLAQRQWDRIYEVYSSEPEPHASLLVPGLLATIAGLAITFEVVLLVSG